MGWGGGSIAGWVWDLPPPAHCTCLELLLCICSSPSINIFTFFITGFPGGSDSKESASNAGDLDSIPGLGRYSAEGNGCPLQYSCLESSMDQGSLVSSVTPTTIQAYLDYDILTITCPLPLPTLHRMVITQQEFCLCCSLLHLPHLKQRVVFSHHVWDE